MFKVLEKEENFLIPYDEKIKDTKTKNLITKRWRELGLVDGIPQNSKTEKLVIEGYERIAIYLIGNAKRSHFLETVLFPLTRLIYTGEKITGKKLYSVVMPEELFTILDNLTLETMKPIIEKHAPKSVSNRIEPLFRLFKYKQINDKKISEINYDDLKLSNDEICLLTALFPTKNKSVFDIEAEIVALLCSCVVFIIKESRKMTV